MLKMYVFESKNMFLLASWGRATGCHIVSTAQASSFEIEELRSLLFRLNGLNDMSLLPI